MILSPPKVAILIDLPRTALSGGHVKGWERRARGAVERDLPLDMTLYFSGPDFEEKIGRHVRIRHLPPVFSTENLRFLPYIPDHTDMAPYHPRLARELADYDIIHTTDGYFNFARTAEKVSRKRNIPLTTSIHTATPAYARIFTTKAIEKHLGKGWVAKKLIDDLDLPGRQERKMENRLRRHLALCQHTLVARHEDRVLAEAIQGPGRVHDVHTCVDRVHFGVHRRDREGIEQELGIAPDAVVILFVGRVDVGKNIQTLIEAAEVLLSEGVPLHVIVAGVGPAEEDVRARLGPHATLAGFVTPHELGRLYASVDGVALTSEVEVRSLVGVEALASGTPVLVSAKSEIAPLFDNTPAMHVVSGKGPEWAAALRRFAGDAQWRKAMSERALEYSDSKFLTWGEEVEQDFLRVWELAMSKKKLLATSVFEA